jgi:hypothetical protein
MTSLSTARDEIVSALQAAGLNASYFTPKMLRSGDAWPVFVRVTPEGFGCSLVEWRVYRVLSGDPATAAGQADDAVPAMFEVLHSVGRVTDVQVESLASRNDDQRGLSDGCSGEVRDQERVGEDRRDRVRR